MNKNQIADALKKLFLDDGRRIVFWYDEKRAFEADFDTLELAGVIKWRLDQQGLLGTKIEIERNRPKDKFLLYIPFPKPRPQDNWLLDILLYSVEFNADRATLIRDTLGLQTPALVGFIAQHLDFFNAQTRMEKLARLVQPTDREDDLDVKMLAVLSGAEYGRIEAVTLALFNGFNSVLGQLSFGLESQPWEDVCKFKMDEAFWRIMRQYCGYQSQKPSLKDLFIHLVVTHFHHQCPKHGDFAFPEALKRFLLPDGAQAVNGSVFIANWMQNTKHVRLYDALATEIESELDIERLVANLKAEDLRDADTFEVLEKHIILCLRDYIVGGADADLKKTDELVAERRDKHWCLSAERSYPAIYDAMLAAGRLFALKNRYAGGFKYDSAKAMFLGYCDELYRFDQAYRDFYMAASKVKQGIDVLKNGLLPAVENYYSNAYMPALASAWNKHIQAELLKRWRLEDVPFQTGFYERYVRPILDERETSKAYVIVSDALRYEVAREIHDRINREDRIESTAEAMLGILPSKTPFGMAALLPHKHFSLTKVGEPMLDGVVVTSSNREEVLRASEPASVVIRADDLTAKTTDEGREFVRDYRVVYIYHDRIDATGDKQATEDNTFEAVERSIGEITSLVDFIHGCLNGSRILITADHGFLFQQGELHPTDKSQWETGGEVYVEKKRYVIGKNLPDQDAAWKISLSAILDEPSDLEVVTPKGVQRFHFVGGAKFAHGGSLLQEIVVPVLKLRALKGKSAETGRARKVDVQLLDTTRKVSNNRQRFTFLQTTKVEGKTLPRTLCIGFYSKKGDLISDERKVTFDSSSDQLPDRQKEIYLTIKGGKYDKTEDYYLVMTDDETGAECGKIAFQLNLGIANEFGGFL
jgi:uncharacterized protein (TIGR02687 family)